MKSNKGFSLVELIVVIAIMAIIAAVAVPAYSAYITKAQDSSNVQEVADLAYAAELACIEYTCKVTQTTVAKDKVVLTFTDATAAAQAGKVIGLTASDKVVTLTFETELSDEGLTKAQAALDRLDPYAG